MMSAFKLLILGIMLRRLLVVITGRPRAASALLTLLLLRSMDMFPSSCSISLMSSFSISLLRKETSLWGDKEPPSSSFPGRGAGIYSEFGNIEDFDSIGYVVCLSVCVFNSLFSIHLALA